MAMTLLPDGSKKYNGGGFSVTIKPDGAILVQPGDSISKYSMAIHGNFDFLNEYKHRRNKPTGPITDSDLQELVNVNMIHAGETLYHMPSRGTSNVPSLPPVPSPGAPGKPQPFEPAQIAKMKHFLSVQVPMLGYGYIKAGQAWLAYDGRRTIISINTAVAAVIFLLEKPGSPEHLKLFVQPVEAFKVDVRNWLVDELGQRLEPLKQFVDLEVAFVLGLVSCINFPAFIIISGVGMFEWVVNNRVWLSKVYDAIKITCKVRRFMLDNAPMLYEKIINAMLHSLWDQVPNVAGNVPEAIANDPKGIASAVGVLLGKLTFSGAKSKFAVLFLVFSMLFTIAWQAVKKVPGAIVLTAEEKARYAVDLINNLRSQGVTISESEANTIIDEVLANPVQLQIHLAELKRAFEAIK
ncbi:MAG: hypothetical protein AB7Q37_06565 [Pyrinomonadaceae bacterium]